MDGKSLKRSGERGRNRTYNLLIKSQLLCQLSYAPFVRNISLVGQFSIVPSPNLRRRYRAALAKTANPLSPTFVFWQCPLFPRYTCIGNPLIFAKAFPLR
jgi:hypothetical protein